MNSEDLKRHGFTKWHKFNLADEEELLKELSPEKGVYAIKHRGAFGRFKGMSDLLYFGSSINEHGGVRSRIRSYFHPGPTQTTSKRINGFLSKIEGLKLSFIVINNSEKVRLIEKRLREDYLNEHGEFPPWNRSA